MAENHRTQFFYGYVVTVAAFFILLIQEGAMYTYGVFVNPLTVEFGWTRAAVSGAYSLFMIVFGLSSIVAGKLNDRFGPRRVVTIYGLFMGLGYLLMSQINAMWQLYLFHGVLVAIGMSGGYVPLTSTVARWFTKRRGLMTGFAVAGIGMGTVIMPPIANWLTSAFGWRSSYTIIGIIVLVVTVMAAQFLKRGPSRVGLSPYGSVYNKKTSLNLAVGKYSLREAVRTRQFWIFEAISFVFGFCVLSIMVHIVPHATELEISPAIAASILGTIGGVSIAGRIVIGGAGDRIGSRPGMTVCLLILAVALFWLLLAREVWMLYLFAGIFGFAYGGFSALESPIVADLFGLGSHGVILGCIGVGSTIGGAIGPVVTGGIFDAAGSYTQAFIICAVLAVICFVLTLFLRPTTGRH